MDRGELIGILLIILLTGIIIGYLLDHYIEQKTKKKEFNLKINYLKSVGFEYNDYNSSFDRGDQMVSLIALKDYYSLSEIKRKYY